MVIMKGQERQVKGTLMIPLPAAGLRLPCLRLLVLETHCAGLFLWWFSLGWWQGPHLVKTVSHLCPLACHMT